jgi:hypothetical protein
MVVVERLSALTNWHRILWSQRLTLPNPPSIPLPTTGASALTAVVSPPLALHLNLILHFVHNCHLVAPQALPKLPSTAPPTPPISATPRTNRETPKAKPIAHRVRRDTGFVQIPLSQVPRREILPATRNLTAGALVDRVLSAGHPLGVVV